MGVVAGIDWASQTHVGCVIDDAGGGASSGSTSRTTRRRCGR